MRRALTAALVLIGALVTSAPAAAMVKVSPDGAAPTGYTVSMDSGDAVTLTDLGPGGGGGVSGLDTIEIASPTIQNSVPTGCLQDPNLATAYDCPSTGMTVNGKNGGEGVVLDGLQIPSTIALGSGVNSLGVSGALGGTLSYTSGAGSADTISLAGITGGISTKVQIDSGGTDNLNASKQTIDAPGSLEVSTGEAASTSETLNLSGVTVGPSASLEVTGGDGADTIDLGGATIGAGASVPIKAGDGTDAVDLTNLQGTLGGPLSVTLGKGAGDRVTVSGLPGGTSGAITIGAGDGAGDKVDLSGVTGIVDASLGVTLGNGPGDQVNLAGVKFAASDPTVSVTTGNGGDDVELSSTQKNISVGMGTGANTLDLSSDLTGDSFTYATAACISGAAGPCVTAGQQAVFSGVGTFDAPDGNNNTIETTFGAHTINAGTGTGNTISYAFEPSTNPVSIDLNPDTINDPHGDTATATEGGVAVTSQITGFQNAVAGAANGNTIEGAPGGGSLDGGSGTGNTVSFAFEPASNGVNINLATGSATPTTGNGYTIQHFQSAIGGQGDDTLAPGTGPGTLDGGPGSNTVSLEGEQAGVTGGVVDLSASPNTVTTAAGVTDTLQNIQGVAGGAGNDTVKMPASGIATAGISFQPTSVNTLDFSADPTGTTFSFTTPTTLSVLARTYANVDSVIGTAGNDTFDDEGTTDTIDGGAGTNTLSYAAYGTGQNVDVNLGTGSATTPAGTSKVSDFQNIVGGNGNDTLTGGSADATIIGGSGNDTIDPGTGNDYVYTGSGNDTIAAGTGHNIIVGGGGADTISFAGQTAPVTIDLTGQPDSGISGQNELLSGIDNAVGGAGDTTIIGNGRNDLLQGGTGNNTLIPGTGNDTIIGGPGPGANVVSFANRPSNDPVTINLSTNSATDGPATDRLLGIQAVIGGAGPDTIIGGPGAETLTGGSGDNTIIGGSGPDTITDGNGNDYIQAGTGGDTITTGTGTTTVQARNGVADTITCGGTGVVIADAIDTTNNCKNVERPAPTLGGNTPPPPPTGLTGATAPPPPPPIVYPRLSARLVARFGRARRGYTRVRQLELKTVGADTNLVASCRSRRFRACPFRKTIRVVANPALQYSLRGLFGDVPLPPGTRVELELIQPGSISQIYTYVFRRGRRPTRTVLCQTPGQKVGKCS